MAAILRFPKKRENRPVPVLPARERSLRIRMSREEEEIVKRLARTKGLSVSDYVRQLVRREYKREVGE